MKASSISTEPGQWRGETVNWRKEVIKYCGRSDPIFFLRFSLVICCIHFVVQSLSGVQLFSTPWTAAHQASLSFTISQSLLKLMSIESVMPSNLLILCRPLLLLPSLFPSIRVFFSESVLRIRWTEYWRFSFVISPSNEYLRLTGWISLKSKGLLRIFSNTTIQKHQFFGSQLSLWSNSNIHT